MKALILFATGGSGGHIFPAIAIAKEAVSKGYNVAFIGSKTGMEASLITEAGYDFYGVETGKWDRGRLNPLVLFKVASGSLEAILKLRKLKPDLVMGFGGFASFPGILAAKLLGIPYILHEGNAFPGKVVRWFASSAQVVVSSYKESLSHLSNLKDTRIIAFPIREKVIDKLEARNKLGLGEKDVVVFVMGGSQGSMFLNNEIPKVYTGLGSSPSILHSSGKKWQSQLQEKTKDLKNYHVVGFVDASLAWSAADLAICRAGVSTLSEAAFYGVPCIVIPLPSSAENHQLHNAKAYEASGAGWLVEEKNISTLKTIWQNALKPDVLEKASLNAKKLSPKGAAKEFITVIEEQLANSSKMRKAKS